MKDLDRSLGNAKLKELRELGLFVESNRNSDKKIYVGKNINDNQFTYKKGPCSVTRGVTAVSYSEIFFLLVSNYSWKISDWEAISIFHLVLGSKMTKEERTSLHRNVRLAFPHLQTETIQSEQEVSKLLKDLSKLINHAFNSSNWHHVFLLTIIVCFF